MKKAGTRGEEEEAEAEGEVTNDEEADDRGGTGGALALEFEKSSSGSWGCCRAFGWRNMVETRMQWRNMAELINIAEREHREKKKTEFGG